MRRAHVSRHKTLAARPACKQKLWVWMPVRCPWFLAECSIRFGYFEETRVDQGHATGADPRVSN
jgi:hypothetical protein